MNKCPYRSGLPEIPAYMQDLPVDHRGYPVPAFVEWIDGKPDFRVIRQGTIERCHRGNLCWVCGKPLAVRKAFVIGPMCAINRISAEPPSHEECALFSATACPFLSLPTAKRREANLPDHQDMPGIAEMSNPGGALVWVCDSYAIVPDHLGGNLFMVGYPIYLRFFVEGRRATRYESYDLVRGATIRLGKIAHETSNMPELMKSVNIAFDLIRRSFENEEGVI